jgi:SAM-dependent methyltransferase
MQSRRRVTQGKKKGKINLISMSSRGSSTWYKEVDLNMFYGSSYSSSLRNADSDARWINMGYWDDNDKFVDACRRLACVVGKEAGILLDDDDGSSDDTVILDLGCGLGDSLLLWDSILEKRKKRRKIIGVNISVKEVEYIRNRFDDKSKTNNDIVILCEDAVEITKCEQWKAAFGPDLKVDTIVSVDSIYHFDSRAQLVENLGKGGVLKDKGRFACADIVLSSKWEQGYIDTTMLSWKRKWFLQFISVVAGVPMCNILCGPLLLRKQLEPYFDDVKIEIITSNVFHPFSMYLWKETTPDKGFRRFFGLLMTSFFMQILAYSEGLDFVIYSGTKRAT